MRILHGARDARWAGGPCGTCGPRSYYLNMRVLPVTASALAVLPLLAQANVSGDVQSLMQQCTGLDFGSWNEYVLAIY